MTTIVFDTETTGLVQPMVSFIQPSMTEFAAIKLDENLDEIDRIEFLINPQCEIPPNITKITGISNEMVSDKKTFPEHLEDLQNFFLGVDEAAGHNLMFDLDMLQIELRRIDKVTQFPWPFKRVCTVEKTKHFYNYRLNLSKLYNYCFDKSFSGSHRAMADTEALKECFVFLRKKGVL